MQEESQREAPINIDSVLSFVKDQLYKAEASIRYAQLELDSLTQIIQNLSTQKDTQLCKCQKKQLEEVTFMCGEKQSRGYQLTHDPVKIAQDFWQDLDANE
jgi:hypothetical protein